MVVVLFGLLNSDSLSSVLPAIRSVPCFCGRHLAGELGIGYWLCSLEGVQKCDCVLSYLIYRVEPLG